MLFCLIMSTMFYGCTESEYGKGKSEPMSFIAEISSRTQTRAAVDTAKNSGTNLIVRAAEPAKGITESVSKMTRTSTADGSWPSGANIAVQQGGTTKQYTVDGTGNITSSSPFYWANKDNISVTSWYPYSAVQPTTWTVNSDQSTEANYGGSDLLYASNTFTYSAGSNNTLKYNHKTAKVVINIVKANDITGASNISFVTIGTSGTPIDLSGTVNSDGSLTALTATTGYITPYQTSSSTYAATYSALVIPQDMNGKQFIAIKVVGGNIFYYMPSTSTVLSGGDIYTYNITVPSTTTSIGDYYFSDGSWGTLAIHANAAVKPIGVIFSNSPSSTDQGYGWKHGYAMALTDASSGCQWSANTNTYSTMITTDEATSVTTFGSFTYVDYAVTYDTFIKNKDGYSETHAINNKYSSTLQNDHPSFYYALHYDVAAPSNSSGWYLPSVGQWWDILTKLGGMPTTTTANNPGWCRWHESDTSGDTNKYASIFVNNMNNYMYAVNKYITPDTFSHNSGYWYSSEYNYYYSYYTCVGGSNDDMDIGSNYGSGKIANYKIRSCVTF